MNKKRNLLEEFNITSEPAESPLDIDISKIKDMVNNSIDSAYSERKSSSMKSIKKISLIAAAAVLVLGVTVFAASGIVTSWHSSSWSTSDYKTLPTAEQCVKDVGYEPVLIDTFKNGYEFKSGSIVSNDLRNEDNNSVEKFKSVDFRYEKDGDQVDFCQDKFDTELELDAGDIISTVDGVDIYYYSYMNKCVPGNYKMTEEDKRAQESGELVFSFGVEKDKIVKVQSVSWIEDGIHYVLMQVDGKLSPDELADMAKEAIEK